MKYSLLPLYPRYSKDYNSEAELLFDSVQDKEVKNIGIVAHYGAGKSSLIKTFRENYSDKELGLRFLNITLAGFNSDLNEKKQIANSEELTDANYSHGSIQDINNAVEKSILQQMLYRKEKSDLPKSQVKRNNNFVASRFVLYFFLIITAAVCITSLILYSLNFNNIRILRFESWDIIYLLLGIISFIIFVPLLLTTISFSKIAFKGIELEINDSNESLLNRFLDEIIYFFQKTKYNLVIFEDLERFDNLSIFSKLRELNGILNNNERISKNGKITFIYAVKDGMFENSQDIKEIATTKDEIEVKNKNGQSKICLSFVIILSVMLALSLLVLIIFSVIKFTSNSGVASVSSTVYNDGVFYGSLSLSIVLALLLSFLIIYMIKIKK